MTSESTDPSGAAYQERLDAPPWVHFALVAATLGTLLAMGIIYAGSLVTGLVVGSGLVSLFAWWRTTYHRPAPRTIFPVYTLAIVALLIHTTVQWAGEYPVVLTGFFPDIFAPPVMFTERVFVASFALGSTAIFLWGGLGLWLAHPLGNYMAWFVFVWAIVDSLSLPFLALAGGGSVLAMPGMASAILPLAVGVYGVRRLLGAFRSGEKAQ